MSSSLTNTPSSASTLSWTDSRGGVIASSSFSTPTGTTTTTSDHAFSSTFPEEDRAFFSSLYSTLDDVTKASNLHPYLRPDLLFMVGLDKFDTHSLVMAQFCTELPQVKVKDEEGQGVLKMVVWVPTEVGVTAQAFKIFRKAIYLKELAVADCDTWLMVRRLAEHYGCDMLMKKCDAVPISLTNCHSFFNNIPNENVLKQRALAIVKANVKTLIDIDKSLEWSEELWQIVLTSNDLSPPIPSEDDLFGAVLKWQEENKDRVDMARFRLLFKGIFRYPLMTEEFLWSKTFRESGILDDGELLKIYSEKRGLEESPFDRTSRCRSPNNDTMFDFTYVDHGFGLDNEYVWSLGSCHTSTQTDIIFTSTTLEGKSDRFGPVEGGPSTDGTNVLSRNDKQKNKKKTKSTKTKSQRSRSPSIQRKPTYTLPRGRMSKSVSDSESYVRSGSRSPAVVRKKPISRKVASTSSSSNESTNRQPRVNTKRCSSDDGLTITID